MGSRRKMTEREMKATALNKKEERVLQKTFGTLNLEMSFTYNVISLHVRTVKANFRRLRDRVDKLKSYLTPEEITALRQLEEEGKFKPATTFNVNAAMKIAAAARRLNLYPEGLSRSRSTVSAKSNRNSDKLLSSRSKTDTNLLRKRSNSVTGVFIDAPPPDNAVRRNSTTELPVKVAIRPVSAAVAEQTELKTPQRGLRPASSECFDREKIHLPKAVSAKPSTEPSDSISFERPERITEAGTGKMKKSPRDKMAMINITDESLDIGRNKLFEDRRQELLQDEHTFYMNLEKRKNHFIGKVDEYLIQNPPVRFDAPMMPIVIPHAEADDEVMAYSRRRVRKYDTERTFTTEEEYKQREGNLWKDMNKTRYLRVPDEKIDLSGVVTLAKDQMQLYNLVKSTEPAHIITF